LPREVQSEARAGRSYTGIMVRPPKRLWTAELEFVKQDAVNGKDRAPGRGPALAPILRLLATQIP